MGNSIRSALERNGIDQLQFKSIIAEESPT